jgi:hypothetical protein
MKTNSLVTGGVCAILAAPAQWGLAVLGASMSPRNRARRGHKFKIVE